MNVERAAQGDGGDDLRTKVAWLYHMEGLTQDRISEILGLSRSRVLRILAAARQSGMVQVRVTTKLSHCVALERALEQKYGVIRGALRLLKPHVLVTDELVAERLAAEGKA